MQLFSADPAIFKKKINFFFAVENKEKPPSKVAYYRPEFSIAQNQPKSQFPLKLLTAQLLYNDFGFSRLGIRTCQTETSLKV